jgi:hypothetical protein
MPRVLDPIQFVMIALAGWMNQRQLVVLVKFRNLKVGHDLAFRAGMGFQGKGGS